MVKIHQIVHDTRILKDFLLYINAFWDKYRSDDLFSIMEKTTRRISREVKYFSILKQTLPIIFHTSSFLKRSHCTSRISPTDERIKVNNVWARRKMVILPHVSWLKVLWRRDGRLKTFWRSFQQRVLARGRLFGAFGSARRAITVFAFLRNWYTGRITSVL